MHVAGLQGQRFFFFLRKYKMPDEDSHSTDQTVSGEEGHSDPLRVAAEAAARLRTPAPVMLRYHLATSKVSYLDELHVSAVVYKSMPTGKTF